jgi:hypothetical protein
MPFHDGIPDGLNSIHDDPMDLTVGVVLNVLRFQVRHWRRHLLRKWHSRVLSIKSVANLAVVSEVFLAFFHIFLRIRDRVLVFLASDRDLLLYLCHDIVFHRAGFADLAGRKEESWRERYNHGGGKAVWTILRNMSWKAGRRTLEAAQFAFRSTQASKSR